MTSSATDTAAARPGTTTTDALVRLDHVSRRYQVGGAVVTALEDVDVTIRAGEFTVILGPSGSGKTTLLNMVGALDSPTGGRIVVAGGDITGWPAASCRASAASTSASSSRPSTSSPA